MKKLLAGMVRFQNEIFPRSRHIYQQLAREQQPETLFICCSDSRVVPHDLTQTLPGELFICRNARNIVPAHGDVLGGVSATVEYAVLGERLQHIGAEAANRAFLDGEEDFVLAGEPQQHVDVERLGEARVRDRRRKAIGRELVRRLKTLG